ncbi:phospholipase effector Tle1 domain-containing protein [Sphingobacterium bovistauri]|uniref:DUF2235 domain-containing protein n=1 Tax=Sphingobacterium bovistauri TaxID=2781959 RepID=A0ABS7Z0L8_9SPHI|nr:DUF2235 domain-containing protein [Sphingobacterium bovistauri]MCA5003712.1 DUF2235 domain-containing protein [Sphingobacterium bovistauri]
MPANIIFGTSNPVTVEGTKYINLEFGVFFDGTKNNKNNSDARDAAVGTKERKAFEEFGKKDKESSYYNDWSNVARKWKHYHPEKSIYIEGIGTGVDSLDVEQFASDTTKAFAVGTGHTGIRGKVRKGCKALSEKIKLATRDFNKNKVIGKIYIDVFGFSRGAAAARNFVYEIHKSRYIAHSKSYSGGIGHGALAYKDSDGFEVPENLIKNGYLPAGGHLGLELSRKGLYIHPTKLVVRFLGIYDTVSSYANLTELKWKQGLPLPNFSNDVNQLNLNTLKVNKIVHFTARDEHRENFALTKVSHGIEKTFPGVHSDIGGGYITGEEIKKEIETSWFAQFKTAGLGDLEELRKVLISEGWFKSNQLSVRGGNVLTPHRLHGARFVKKEYSYIPLHFMCDYIGKADIKLLETEELLDEYNIDKHPLLQKTKKYLKSYVLDENNKEALKFEWYSEIHKTYKGVKSTDPKSVEYTKKLREQEDLRVLRNEYLHWSSDRDGIGMDPNTKWYDLKNAASSGRKRTIY